jgi:hypothetical protein
MRSICQTKTKKAETGYPIVALLRWIQSGNVKLLVKEVGRLTVAEQPMSLIPKRHAKRDDEADKPEAAVNSRWAAMRKEG